MSIKSELKELLNVALAMEHAAIIQYGQHAEIITGECAEPIMARLKDSQHDEEKHADVLRGLIGDYLLDVPGASVSPIKELVGGTETLTVLNINIDTEREAIAHYKKVLGFLMANMLDPEISDIYERIEHDVRHILMEEMEHVVELKRLI